MTRTEVWLLHLSLLALALSGAALGLSRYLLEPSDPFSAVGAPWEPMVLHAHVLAAPVFVFAVGFVFRRHVLRKLADPRRIGRSSGILLLAAFTLSAVSGYLVQVVTGDTARWAIALAHLLVGLGLGVLYVLHARLGRAQDGDGPDGARTCGDEDEVGLEVRRSRRIPRRPAKVRRLLP